MPDLQVKRITGNEVVDYLDDVARLRIQVFREYPYLYDGDLAYEKDYLQTYAKSAQSMIAIVLDGKQIVGASTAIPMINEVEEMQTPFLKHDMDIKSLFYLGESILLPQYRGQGIYRQLFAHREAAAKENNCSKAAFLAVIRDKNDPRQPAGYQPLDEVWKYFGYQPYPEIVAYFTWKEVDEETKTEKPLMAWMKKLS